MSVYSLLIYSSSKVLFWCHRQVTRVNRVLLLLPGCFWESSVTVSTSPLSPLWRSTSSCQRILFRVVRSAESMPQTVTPMMSCLLPTSLIQRACLRSTDKMGVLLLCQAWNLGGTCKLHKFKIHTAKSLLRKKLPEWKSITCSCLLSDTRWTQQSVTDDLLS